MNRHLYFYSLLLIYCYLVSFQSSACFSPRESRSLLLIPQTKNLLSFHWHNRNSSSSLDSVSYLFSFLAHSQSKKLMNIFLFSLNIFPIPASTFLLSDPFTKSSQGLIFLVQFSCGPHHQVPASSQMTISN